jgi:hypothetical protein
MLQMPGEHSLPDCSGGTYVCMCSCCATAALPVRTDSVTRCYLWQYGTLHHWAGCDLSCGASGNLREAWRDVMCSRGMHAPCVPGVKQ